jgi:hypothetical protein
MSAPVNYIDKLKTPEIAAWLVTLLLLITGFRFIKKVIAFILMTLHEFFIQRNVLKL